MTDFLATAWDLRYPLAVILTAAYTVTALAEALGGRTVDHFGDTRVLVHADLIYCAPNGTVKLDHRGRITVLGTWDTPTDELAAAYRTAVRR